MKISKIVKKQVVVVGGGVAGCAAALSAARNGAETLLIESSGVLGGQAGLGIVTPLDSRFTLSGESFGGILGEISDGVSALSEKYCTNNPEEGDHWQISAPHIVKYFLLKLLRDAGVEIRFHSTLCDSVKEGKEIKKITVLEKSGFTEIFADVFIDASGDGDLFALSGCDFSLGSENGVYDTLKENDLDLRHNSEERYQGAVGVMQPVSIFFTMGGVDYEKASALNNKHLRFGDYGITRERFEKWEFANTCGFELSDDDSIPLPQGRVLVSRGTKNDVAVINMSRIIGINGADSDSLSEGEIKAQLQLIAIVDFLQSFIPGFEKSYLIQSGATLGIRETRRLRGKYILSGGEVISCKTFPDAIARGSYIIDLHDPKGKSSAIGGSIKGDFYEIPYGSLICEQADNLLVCGRCISVDHIAHASTRIQGTCILTGQAAGTAAALSVKSKTAPSLLDGTEVRKLLKEQGVNI